MRDDYLIKLNSTCLNNLFCRFIKPSSVKLISNSDSQFLGKSSLAEAANIAVKQTETEFCNSSETQQGDQHTLIGTSPTNASEQEAACGSYNRPESPESWLSSQSKGSEVNKF
jgi:hypothetical protein